MSLPPPTGRAESWKRPAIRDRARQCPLFSKAAIQPWSAQCPLCANSGHHQDGVANHVSLALLAGWSFRHEASPSIPVYTTHWR